MTILSVIALLLTAVPLAYLLLLAFGSVRRPRPNTLPSEQPCHRFLIAIPAHDEANVIADTISHIRALNYPANLFTIHVIADHCSDATAQTAREAGVIVHERNTGLRTGKGAVLSWFFERAIIDDTCDAVAIFDADTRVSKEFLRLLDARLTQGDLVIQGQHLISNPDRGWFPGLTWAMFLVDNRFQNLGRVNLGWSAKNMGDSICFRVDVLRKFGWSDGLADDYELRQRLLLEGIKIAYEPEAIGCGEAPLSWAQARIQRTRWIQGTRQASQKFARLLLAEGLKRRDTALLDGALQAYLPSYSTLTMISIVYLLLQLLANWQLGPVFPWSLIAAWTFVAGILFIYPLTGLAFERAPLRAYLAIMSGPFFILWRTWLAVSVRLSRGRALWIRTAHFGER